MAGKKNRGVTKVTDLIPDSKNFNKHNAYGMGLLEKSMRKFGFVEAGLISEDNVIASGNARQETAVNIGLEDVQIVDIDGTKPVYLRKKGLKSGTPEFHELALALNQVGQKNVVLDCELIEAELGEAVCEEWGIELPENEVTEDDFDAEPPLQPITVLGDLYELDGKHRVLCGDSTDSDTVAKLMDGKKADMVFTDPPYGITIVAGNGKVGGDNAAKNGVYSEVIGDDTIETAKEFYQCCVSLGMDNFIIWGGNYFTSFLPFSKSWIIWDKRGDMNSNNFADGEMAWCSFESRVRIYKQIWNGMIREGEKDRRVHPTQKPVKMLAEIITDHVTGDIIYDGFLGSGSTLIAADQLNTACYGQELDPAYCDIIVARYIKFKQSSGTPFTIKRNSVQLTDKDIQKYLAQIEPKDGKAK